MSNAVFPTLPGLEWSVVKRPQWNTIVHQSVAAKETRYQFYSAPLWKWTLSYSVLREASALAELQTLVGFFNARQGSFDSFLFTDPSDHAVTDQSIGTGDGANKKFQLVRDYGAGGFTGRENVYDVNGTATIKVAGVVKTLTTDYTIDGAGMVTFVTAPTSGQAVTWTGQYYWRVRFVNDAQDFENFLYQLWQAKTVSFQTVK